MPVPFLHNPGKSSLAVMLVALLIVIVSSNFFLYNIDSCKQDMATLKISKPACAANLPGGNETIPQESDESTSDNAVSVSEEFLSEQSDLNFLLSRNLIKKIIPSCSKVYPVHLELITPPPDISC